MTLLPPAVLSDDEILDHIKTRLVDVYERGPETSTPESRRHLRHYLRAALDRGITARRISSHTRVPGTYIISLLDRPAEQAAAWNAEIHHLERTLAAARLARAHYAHHLVAPWGNEKPMTKMAVAELFGVSRPTLDAWIQDSADHDRGGRPEEDADLHGPRPTEEKS